jgi:nucleoside-diphosphate kinase
MPAPTSELERTLAIVKPDAVARSATGEILRRIEAEGLRVVALKMLRLSVPQAQGFYAVHRERPFFKDLVEFMTSGPVVAAVLEGPGAIARWRVLMGPTDSRKAAPGTIRGDFGSDIERNACHGSDAPETARVEIAYLFNATEVMAAVEALPPQT